jgi:site-specific DNA recombinase
MTIYRRNCNVSLGSKTEVELTDSDFRFTPSKQTSGGRPACSKRWDRGRVRLDVMEEIGERIRDKFAASRKRGMWMGGWAPLGYQVKDRKLIVNEVDAKLVRSIFQRFLKTGSATVLARELIAENVRNRYGKLIDKGILYKMLSNPVYIGVAVHKGTSYPGEHGGIIDQKIWDRVQARFQQSPRIRE